MGLIKKLGSFLINFSIFFLIVTFSPGLPPKTTFPFEEFSIVKPKPLIGALEINNHLDNAEHILVGKVPGAEYLLPRGNSFYASLQNGNVVRIDGEHVTFIANFGKPCELPEEEHICGRPLGMAFDTQGDNLIVADAYYGLWQVDLKTNQKKQLVTPDKQIGVNAPRPAKVFNGVAVAKNGDIFFSHSSSEFDINDGTFSFFANPSGRLIHYERKTGKLTVVLDHLFFANGVALSPEEDFVIVAETHASRIQKYYLTGPKKGQAEVFAEGLPGTPDNLTPDEDGLWISLVVSADPQNPLLPQSLTPLPLFRKFLLRLLHLIEMPFTFITNVYPNPYTKYIAYKIGGFTAFSFLFPSRATIVRTDWNGKIIGSLHGFDHSVRTASHLMELNDYLYIGSPYNNFISKVKFINKDKIHPVKVQTKAPVTQPPTTKAPATKAPTTTQPPTTTRTTTTKAPTTTQAQTTTPAPTTTTTPRPTTTKASTTTVPPTTSTAKTPPPATLAPVVQDSIVTTQPPPVPVVQAPVVQDPVVVTTQPPLPPPVPVVQAPVVQDPVVVTTQPPLPPPVPIVQAPVVQDPVVVTTQPPPPPLVPVVQAPVVQDPVVVTTQPPPPPPVHVVQAPVVQDPVVVTTQPPPPPPVPVVQAPVVQDPVVVTTQPPPPPPVPVVQDPVIVSQPPPTKAQEPVTQKPVEAPKTVPKPAQKAPEKPKPVPVEPAPIHEKVKDIPPPPPEPIKVIKRDGPTTV